MAFSEEERREQRAAQLAAMNRTLRAQAEHDADTFDRLERQRARSQAMDYLERTENALAQAHERARQSWLDEQAERQRVADVTAEQEAYDRKLIAYNQYWKSRQDPINEVKREADRTVSAAQRQRDRIRSGSSRLPSMWERQAQEQEQRQYGSYMDRMTQPARRDEVDEDQLRSEYGTDYVRMLDRSQSAHPDLEAASQYGRALGRYDSAIAELNAKEATARQVRDSEVPRAQTVLDYEKRHWDFMTPDQAIRELDASGVWNQNAPRLGVEDKTRETIAGIYASITGDYSNAENRYIYNAEMMSDEEKATVLNMVRKNDWDGVKGYMEALQPTLDARSFDKQKEQIDNMSKVGQGATSVIGSFIRPLGYGQIALDTAKSAVSRALGGPGVYTDLKSGAVGLTRLSDYAREKSLEDASGFGRFVGNALYSTLDNAVLMPLGQVGALVWMSAGAAGQTAIETLERGGTQGQALLSGAASGVVEYLTEKLPLENLFNILEGQGIRGLKEYLKAVAKQAGSEGIEEFISEFAGTLADRAIMGQKSEYLTRIRELEQTMSHDEAVSRANYEFFIKNPTLAAVAGALSGAIMAGASGTVNAGRTARADLTAGREINQGRELSGSMVDVVLDEGMKSSDSRIKAEAWALDAIRHENRANDNFQWSNAQLRQIGEIYDSLDTGAKARVSDETVIRSTSAKLDQQEAEAKKKAAEQAEADRNMTPEQFDEEISRLAQEASNKLDADNPETMGEEMTPEELAADMQRRAAAAEEATRTGDRSALDQLEQEAPARREQVQTEQPTATQNAPAQMETEQPQRTASQPVTPEQAARNTAVEASKAGLSAEDVLVMSNVARELGANLRFRNITDSRIHGIYNRDTQTVVLNQNLSSAEMAWTAFAHEITHHSESAGSYSQLTNIAKQIVASAAGSDDADDAWQAYIKQKRRQYADVGYELSQNDAEYEAVATTIEHVLGSREAMEGVARYSREDAEALLASIDNVLDRTTENSTAITPEAARLVQAQKVLAAALNEVKAQQETQAESTSTSQTTANDTGNVIPLSERFTDNPDIRYSVGGFDFETTVKEAIERYGRMKPGVQYTDEQGNRITREENMANAYEDGKKARKTYRTAAESINSDPILNDIHTRAVLDQYTPKTNAETVAEAKAVRGQYGSFDKAFTAWQTMVRNGLSARNYAFEVQVAFGTLLYNEALHTEHNGKAAIEILTDIAQFETALGRGAQASVLLKKLSPEGELIKVQRLAQIEAEKLQPKDNGTGKKRKIPKDVKAAVDAVDITDELREKINELRELKKLEENGGKLTGQEKEKIDLLMEEIFDKQKELAPLRKTLDALTKERHDIAQEVGKLRREATWLEGTDGKPGKLARLAKEIHDLDDEIMFLNADLLPKRKELQSKIANERLTREERNILARELRSVNHSIEKATKAIADHQHEINTLNHNLIVKRIEMESRLAEERMTRAQRNELAKELRSVNTSLKNLNQLIWEHQQDITNYMEQMNVKEATLDELTQYEQVLLNSREIMRTYLRYVKNHGQVEIPLELQTQFLNAKTDEEREKIRYQMDMAIADQLPGTWAEKWRAWRYTSMLFNPTTHERNILGNSVQFGIAGVSDTIAAGIEAATMKGNAKAYSEAVERVAKLRESLKEINENKDTSQEYKDIQSKRIRASIDEALNAMTKNERRHAIVMPKVDAALYKAATDDFNIIKDDLQAGGKASETSRIEEMRTIYTSWLGRHTLEPIRKWGGMALEKEDAWFLQGNYTRSFAEYLKANGIDPKTMTEDQRNRARAIAFEDALEATYRDASALANKLNDIEKMNPFARFFMAGFMPFKKTPINIAKRAIEYSPVGLIRSSAQLIKIANGSETNRTKSEAIGNFCKGFTGTALVAIGFLLAGAGKIKLLATPGADDKTRDKKMDEATGQQNYAIQIGDKFTYTMDWLVPASIPLFIGARMREVWSAIQDKNFTGAKLADATIDGMISMMNPLFELTMLDGVTNLLKSYQNEGSGVAAAVMWSVIESYALQGLPTLGGKLARVIDPYQRSTKAQSGTAALKEIEKLYRRGAAKIPGVAQIALEPVMDQYGNAKLNVGSNWIKRLGYNMFSPGYFKAITHFEPDEEMKRLYAIDNNTEALPKEVPTYITFGGETYYLNAKQYKKYSETMGKTAYSELEKLYATDEYKNANDTMKLKMTSAVWDDAYEKAKREYFEDIDVLDDYLRSKLDSLVYDDSEGERKYRNLQEVRDIYEQNRMDLTTVEAAASELSHISGIGAKIETLNAINDAQHLTQDEYDFLYMTKIAGTNMQEDMQAVIDVGGDLNAAINTVARFYGWDDSYVDPKTGEVGRWIKYDKGTQAAFLSQSRLSAPAKEALYLNNIVSTNNVEKEQAKIDDYKSRGLGIDDYLTSLGVKYDDEGTAYENNAGFYRELYVSDLSETVKEAAIYNLARYSAEGADKAQAIIDEFKRKQLTVNDYLLARASQYDDNDKSYTKMADKSRALLKSGLSDKAMEVAFTEIVSDAQGVPDEIKTWKAGGMDIRSYIEAKAATSGEGMKLPDKAKAILDMKLNSYTTAIKSVVTTSENKAEGIDAALSAGIKDRTIAEAYAKYAEINAREDLNGSGKATEFSIWLDRDSRMSDLTETQKSIMKDAFKYYNMVAADAGKYDSMMRLDGMRSSAAESMSADIRKLEPLEGKKSVSDLQIIEAIANNKDATDKEKDAAIKQVLDSSGNEEAASIKKYNNMRNAGFTSKQYVEYRHRFDSYTSDRDANGKEIKGRTKQDKISAYIGSQSLSRAQKKALWHLAGYADSTLEKQPWY